MMGYKLLNDDYTGEDCESKVTFRIGEIYETKGVLELYKRGFHFKDSISKLGFKNGMRVVEVNVLGEIKSGKGALKCTNKIKIDRELSIKEIINAHNIGSNCDGLYNVGGHNSGDYNTGGYNNGNFNVGEYNNGDCNVGDYNNGDCNVLNHNDGNYNVGTYNKGDYNVGDWNVGTGCCGAFNTEAPRMKFFNETALWTIYDWFCSDARRILQQMPTDESDRQKWWSSLNDKDKWYIKMIPNFNSTIFKTCTGIDVNKEEEK